jgi:hypothetical protein
MVQNLSYFPALEYTGGVPYDLLKPVLQHATPDQLFTLEHHNPYLIEDTGELWQFHCQREFRTKQRQDMETAREMYMVSLIAMILQLGLAAQKYCYIISRLCPSSCVLNTRHFTNWVSFCPHVKTCGGIC